MEQKCEFCASIFVKRNKRQRTCGSGDCQKELIKQWNRVNPDKVREANTKYKKSERGKTKDRINKSRFRDLANSDRIELVWSYAITEKIHKKLRREKQYFHESEWELRIQSIAKNSNIRASNYQANIGSRIRKEHGTIFESIEYSLKLIQSTLKNKSNYPQQNEWSVKVNSLQSTMNRRRSSE